MAELGFGIDPEAASRCYGISIVAEDPDETADSVDRSVCR
jgi:hypothetical protein